MKEYIPHDSDVRKTMPLARGLLDYFPAALAAVAQHSYYANEKHNPGEDINWSRGKSSDHADCVARHLIERGQVEEVTLPDGRVIHLRASAALAWRALALLQEELEAEGATPGRASRFPGDYKAKTVACESFADFEAAMRASGQTGYVAIEENRIPIREKPRSSPQWSEEELAEIRRQAEVDDYMPMPINRIRRTMSETEWLKGSGHGD